MEFSFGSRSQQQLETCHPDLQIILLTSLAFSPIDFGITEGYRSTERQKSLYDQGRSKIDGISKRSKHNHFPSLAADIYIYHPDTTTRRKLAYDIPHLSFIGGIIVSVAEMLLFQEKITHRIRWGANWDSDGIIDYDQSFDDYPHFELVPS